jgi:hypothetical protein
MAEASAGGSKPGPGRKSSWLARISHSHAGSEHEIEMFVLIQCLLERTARKPEKPKYSLFLITRRPAVTKPLKTNVEFVLDVLSAPSP